MEIKYKNCFHGKMITFSIDGEEKGRVDLNPNRTGTIHFYDRKDLKPINVMPSFRLSDLDKIILKTI